MSQNTSNTTSVKTVATETSSQVMQPTGKFGHLPNVCAVCGKPIVGGCVAGTVGSTCLKFYGKPSSYKPVKDNPSEDKGYIALSTLCRLAEQHGRTAGFVVRLTGGDKGNKCEIHSPIFQVYKYGSRKYLKAGAREELLKLLKE